MHCISLPVSKLELFGLYMWLTVGIYSKKIMQNRDILWIATIKCIPNKESKAKKKYFSSQLYKLDLGLLFLLRISFCPLLLLFSLLHYDFKFKNRLRIIIMKKNQANYIPKKSWKLITVKNIISPVQAQNIS